MFSRQARIITLLVIDVIFFFIEISVGYAVKSLALVADSFHMLNDVLSLLVALYAIKLATSPSTSKNSYGWQRAEILGALINGVFLLALCFSIFLDAIERFVNISEVSNPKLVIIVGSLGLASNIIGLFLFHEHGHSHGGGHSHSHGDDDDDEDAIESTSSTDTPIEADFSSNSETTAVAVAKPISAHTHHHHRRRKESESGGLSNGGANANGSGGRRDRSDSFGSLYGHPAQTRAAVIETAQEFGYGRQHHSGVAFSPRDEGSPLTSPRLANDAVGGHRAGQHSLAGAISNNGGGGGGRSRSRGGAARSSAGAAAAETTADHQEPYRDDVQGEGAHAHGHGDNDEHGHAHAHDLDEAEAGGHHDHAEGGHGHSHGAGGGSGHGHGGHSHGNMNMRGVFLHVLGDALGNVGVITAGLVILLAHGDWKYYFDPAISLVITVIIFSSALPLVKSASYILMQGVPGHISLEAVRASISRVDGVVSLHELHVWQLSEKTVVASVHVMVSRGHEYMAVAEQIRKALHEHGVHSSTIQPEFGESADDHSAGGSSDVTQTACLIRCPPDSCGEDTCCPPVGQLVDVDGNETTQPQQQQQQQEGQSNSAAV